MSDTFEPLIIGFTCNWCSYRAADLAGISRKKYPPNIRLIRLMCSGRLDPSFVLKAFAGGADGVLVSGCHPGECHYLEQNFKMLRRFTLLKRMIAQMGIEPERLRLVWASAAEGIRFAEKVTEMVEDVRALGPLNWSGNGHVRHVAESLLWSGDGAQPAGVGEEAEPSVKVAKPAGTPVAAKPASPPGTKKVSPPGAKKVSLPGTKPAGPPKATKPAGPPAPAKPASRPEKTKTATPPPGGKVSDQPGKNVTSEPEDVHKAKSKEV